MATLVQPQGNNGYGMSRGMDTKQKIASEMPVPHSLGKYFSTPWDIEVVKQYKVQDTFRAVSVILRSK